MWNCTHFRHSTIEQLQHIDVSSNNNLLAIPFELRSFRQAQSPSPVGLAGLWSLSHIDGYMRHNTLSTDIWILVHNTPCNISTALQEHFWIVLNVLSLILMISSKNCHTFQLPCSIADIHPSLPQLQRAYFNSWIVYESLLHPDKQESLFI